MAESGRRSLRAGLLAWVLLPVGMAVALDGWLGHRDALRTATEVQDRLLLGAARIVAEHLRFEDGSFRENIPPAALELFQAREVDRIFYRVTTVRGRLITGYDELQLPRQALQSEVPVFYDSMVEGRRVREVAYLQPVVGVEGVPAVTVQIAQTLVGRDEFVLQLWSRAMSQQLLILALVGGLLVWGLRRGLRPMLRLRDAVQARAPGELRPLALDGMPVELTPVVMAINDYAQRLEHHAGAQRVFIQNAAHQLRTPLTVLTTQLTYAMRGDGAMDADVLPAIRDTVHHAAHLVHQLLALSAAEPTGHAPDDVVSVDLASVVQRVLEDLSGRAQSRGIDLGFEGTDVAPASTHPMAAREIVVNLVDNAIRYTQPGGIVTVSLQPLDGRVRLTVEDNGPGIPEALRERVFERFFRVDNADSDGSGLGLPIVREFAAGVGATVALRTPAAGSGLAVDVSFRAAADSRQA